MDSTDPFAGLSGLLSQFQPNEQDKRDALTQAMTAAALSAFNGRGNGWQILGQMGATGLGSYSNALTNAQQQKRKQMQDAMDALQLRNAYQEAQDDVKTRQVLQSRVGAPTSLPQLPIAGVAPKTTAQFGPPDQATNSGFSNLPAAPVSQPTPVNGPANTYAQLNSIADALEQQGLVKKALDYRQMAEKYAPKYTGTKTVLQNGKPVLMQEYGNQDPTAIAGFQPLPDTQILDTGGQFQAVDKNNLAPGTTFLKSMTPDAVASNKLGWANYAQGDRRLAFDMSKNDSDNAKLQFITGNDGAVYAVNPRTGQGAPATDAKGEPLTKGAKALTEVQGNATAFGMRMHAANDIINSLEDSGFDLANPANLFAANRVTNYAATPNARAAYQAKLNFMTASLRKESGAAINKSEFDSEDKKYFPQPGDDAKLIAQKRQMRALAEQAMAVQAGPGAKNIGMPATDEGWHIRQVR